MEYICCCKQQKILDLKVCEALNRSLPLFKTGTSWSPKNYKKCGTFIICTIATVYHIKLFHGVIFTLICPSWFSKRQKLRLFLCFKQKLSTTTDISLHIPLTSLRLPRHRFHLSYLKFIHHKLFIFCVQRPVRTILHISIPPHSLPSYARCIAAYPHTSKSNFL